MTRMTSRNEKSFNIPVPLYGMNTTEPPHLLPPGQGLDLYNVELNEIKGINKRSGYAYYNTSTQAIPRHNTGTIKEITGAMVYGSSVTWSTVAASDVFKMGGDTTFYVIASAVGTATLSLNIAYTGTATAGAYIIAPKRVNSLYNFKYGTTQTLIAYAGTDGYYSTAGTTGSFSRMQAKLTDDKDCFSAAFQDNLFFCNGYEFKKWDGSDIFDVGGTPTITNPKYISTYTIGNANYLASAGSNTAGYKSAFQFSDVNAPETYPAANLYYAGDRDGSVITGICAIPSGFVIFKEYSIFVFNGVPGSGSMRKVVSDVGCISPKSLKVQDGMAYFIGRRGGRLGLFRFNGSPDVEDLTGTSIDFTLNALTQSAATNIPGEIFEDKYIFSARSASGNRNDSHFICYFNRPFVYGANRYYPCAQGNRGVESFLNMDISGVHRLFSASTVNGFVFLEESGTTDATDDNLYNSTSAITSYAESAWFDFKNNTVRKELLRGYVNATESGDWNLSIQLYKDFQTYGYDTYNINIGSTAMIWSDVVYGVTAWQTSVDKAIHELFFNYPNIARYFKFRWVNNTASEYFTVYPMSVYFKSENR